jgi:phosphoesterase RecJ-like protein
MALGTHQQFHTLLKEKKHVLITSTVNTGGDGIASAVALTLFFDYIGIRSDIVIQGSTHTEQYTFLPKVQIIKKEFEYLKKCILHIDIGNSGIQELSYDIDKSTNKLRIYITPKQGEIAREQITTSESLYKYDAIVTLDADDLESLGTLYEEHAALFFETPLINIGHTPANEHYGNINIVDITASSTAEVVYEILSTIGKEHISEDIAMALLTGMISKTNSFKEKDISPKSLAIAGALMKLGANRDLIIEKLYRTRTINSLKLWGEALTHLHVDNEKQLVWTSLTRESFSRSGAREHDLLDLVPELISSSPNAKTIVILHEHESEHSIHGIVYSKPGIDSRELVKQYHPTGNAKAAKFFLAQKTLKEAEDIIISSIQQQL